MIFYYINKRIKNLACKKFTMVNNTSSDNVDTDGVLREIIVFPHIRSISNKIIKSINKSKNMIGYKCLNKLNKFIKFKRTKINMIKIIMSYIK